MIIIDIFFHFIFRLCFPRPEIKEIYSELENVCNAIYDSDDIPDISRFIEAQPVLVLKTFAEASIRRPKRFNQIIDLTLKAFNNNLPSLNSIILSPYF